MAKNQFGIGINPKGFGISLGEQVSRGSLKKDEKEYLFWKYKGNCQGCGRKLHRGIDEEFGHKKAVAKGGKTTIRNIVLLCRKCNHLQGTGSLSDLKRKLKNLKKYGRTRARKRGNKKSNVLGSFGIPKMKPIKLEPFKF